MYRGQNLINGEQVAIKVIDLSGVLDPVFLRMMENEIGVMKMIRGPNVLRLYDDYTSVDKRYIITELCESGDLNRYIKQRGRLSEDESLNILKHLLLGLSEIQKSLIIHRDIKPANIFIQNGIPKLADFGFSV